MTNLYDFTVSDQADQPVSLRTMDKVVLIVNTATECVLTPQLSGLAGNFMTNTKTKDSEILDFSL